MLKPLSRSGGARMIAFAAIVAACAVLAGCAGNESYNNDPKPPATRTVSVIVHEDEIAASPNPFGAGPTRFIVTNQTGAKQLVTFSTDRVDRDVLVDVQQTANFKMTLEEGFLGISADNSAANTLEIAVGPERPSAQQDLNQP